MSAVHCTGSLWWGGSWKAKLSIYQSTLTYGQKLWVVTERMRLWIQSATAQRELVEVVQTSDQQAFLETSFGDPEYTG